MVQAVAVAGVRIGVEDSVEPKEVITDLRRVARSVPGLERIAMNVGGMPAFIELQLKRF